MAKRIDSHYCARRRDPPLRSPGMDHHVRRKRRQTTLRHRRHPRLRRTRRHPRHRRSRPPDLDKPGAGCEAPPQRQEEAHLPHGRPSGAPRGQGRRALAPLVHTLALHRLRWGEAIAIRVSALDTLRRRILVEENAVNVGTRIVVGTPKTHEARSVPYPKFLSEPLAREPAKGNDATSSSSVRVTPSWPLRRADKAGSGQPCRRQRQSTRHSPTSPLTTCGTQPRAWPSQLARTPKPCKGCSVTPPQQ